MSDRSRYYDGDFGGSRRSGIDEPQNSRLFIVCNKQLTEDDFRNAFSKFGEIEEIWVVKDRVTGERKGVTYIKFSKTSEAAAAMEEMNGKTIGSCPRHIKVMIAASRDQGSKREGNEEERMLRLFIIVSKSMTDEELTEHFKQFGEIDYASVIRDKDTKESKGFAYIKYFKFSHAAKAYENCDRKFKAVFAEPRRSKNSYDMEGIGGTGYGKLPLLPCLDLSVAGVNDGGYTRLHVICSPFLNQDQLWKLFDIIPGLDYCQLRNEARFRGGRHVTVVYANSQAAAYAKEKLHGFEYPPGQRLIVKPDPDARETVSNSNSPRNALTSPSRTAKPLTADLAHLAETIAQATSLIQAAGLTPETLLARHTSSIKDDSYCSVSLPPVQPLANIDAEVVARCFIVCSPQPPPIIALRDAFCRFGNLIDVYTLTNRNCGYAKYANKDSAEMAIRTLHGAEVCGIRLKVLKAEERRDDEDRRKRLRMDT